MGTTQRIIPGVTGEPNWPQLHVSITSIANAIDQENKINSDIESTETPSEVELTAIEKNRVTQLHKTQRKLQQRKAFHFKSALRSLILTGGGRNKVSSGKSYSLGRAGVSSSKRLSGFVVGVYHNGLEGELRRIGFGDISGKSINDIIDYLLIYFSDNSSGMDEVAANMASCHIMEMLSEDLDSVDALELKLHEVIEGNKLTEVICEFYGFYLFEHLSQRFNEKIQQLKGEEVCKETFQMIKDDILDQVKQIHLATPLSDIDWKGPIGHDVEEKIFDSIIQIFE